MTTYGRLIMGAVLCIVQILPTRASLPDGGNNLQLPRTFQLAAAVPVLGRVAAPTYLASRSFAGRQGGGTVTFDGLYNEESITMPSWLWNEVKDLNAQLKDRLPASDYLTILKGENQLFGQHKTKGEYLRAVSQNKIPIKSYINTVQDLRKKLGEILANPTSDQIFPRPRFVERSKKGVMFLENLRYSHDEITCADESYILGVRKLSILRDSWLWSFWDSRTGTQKTQFVCPVYVPPITDYVFGRKIGKNPVYCLDVDGSVEAYYSAGEWNHTCYAESYLVAPQELKFQAIPRNRPGFGEQPETGSLYKMSKPIPKPVYVYGEKKEVESWYKKVIEPWYTGKESGIELYHIPVQKNELDFAWGKERTPRADHLLFLDSLAQYSQAKKQKGDDAKLVKDKIARLMQPAPRNYGDDELAQIDTECTWGGVYLFPSI